MDEQHGEPMYEEPAYEKLTEEPVEEPAPKRPRMLSRDQILSVNDLKPELVDVPEWGGSVWVRALTGLERDLIEEAMIAGRSGGETQYNFRNLRAKTVAASIVDDDGLRMFAEEDVFLLGNKNVGALQRVFRVCQRLSGLSREDVEQITGNSEGASAGSSTTA
jgi:hypothetical protein